MAARESEVREGVGSSLWLGVGLAGVVGFLLAVLRIVFLNADLGLVVAAGCGALAYFALDTYWAMRQAELRRGPKRRPLTGRAREIALAPSFEVYDPRRAKSAEAEVPPKSPE